MYQVQNLISNFPLNYLQKHKLHKLQKLQIQYKTAYPEESFEGTILSFAGIENTDFTSVKWLLLTGVRLDIQGLTLSDLKFCILSVFMQPFPGHAGGFSVLT